MSLAVSRDSPTIQIESGLARPCSLPSETKLVGGIDTMHDEDKAILRMCLQQRQGAHVIERPGSCQQFGRRLSVSWFTVLGQDQGSMKNLDEPARVKQTGLHSATFPTAPPNFQPPPSAGTAAHLPALAPETAGRRAQARSGHIPQQQAAGTAPPLAPAARGLPGGPTGRSCIGLGRMARGWRRA